MTDSLFRNDEERLQFAREFFEHKRQCAALYWNTVYAVICREIDKRCRAKVSELP